ncbi:MAG: lycopene cyclase domain-containing protein [Anaerolineae bacterium]
MTYFRFLQIFLGIPLILFGLLAFYQSKSAKKALPSAFSTWPVLNVVLSLIVVAFVWTTPWDNYLVATRVWWYDPNLVTGLVIGYVPVEEYTFFILQTSLTSLITFYLIRQWPQAMAPGNFQPNLALNKWVTLLIGFFWLISTAFLLSGYSPTIYLTLIISWAFIPIMIQTGFGADILWHYRRLVFWGIMPITLFLAGADSIAILAGTWTISSEKTLGILLGSILPIEEFTFFFITNVLVVFGMTLLLARQSHERAAELPVLKNYIAIPNKAEAQ